jgi:hypothetical protein
VSFDVTFIVSFEANEKEDISAEDLATSIYSLELIVVSLLLTKLSAVLLGFEALSEVVFC